MVVRITWVPLLSTPSHTLAWLTTVCAIALAVAHYALFKPIRQLLVAAKAVRSGDYIVRPGPR